MKNKFNRILSSLLVAVMMFAAVASFIPPIEADAAYSPDITATTGYTEDEIKKIVSGTYKYAFATAEEMLAYEMCEGSSISFDRDGDGDNDVTYTKEVPGNWITAVNSTDGKYTLYANEYTGYVYYKNNTTGQIITSNPYNIATDNRVADAAKEQLVSQIEIIYASASGIGNSEVLYRSYQWAAMFDQISVTKIAGGLRVSYTLGDTSTRFLLPGAMTAQSFDEYVARPLIDAYVALLNELIPGGNYAFFGNDKYVTEAPGGIINVKGYKEFNSVMSSGKHKAGFVDFVKDTKKEAETILGRRSAEYALVSELAEDIDELFFRYNLKNPTLEKDTLEEYREDLTKYPEDAKPLVESQQKLLDDMYAECPITKDHKNEDGEDVAGVAVYLWNEATYGDASVKREYAKIITKYCPDIDFTIIYAEEDLCSYVRKVIKNPVFRCSLEYTFNDDGSIDISLPANSIIFDETTYSLRSITPLKFFGAGDMATYKEGGYIFYPDGSGTIIDFSDFYASGINVQLQSQIFGQDYCYSTISGAHREQITMPVYGIVNAVKTGESSKAKTTADYVQNGYFAIIEEGASLAKLGVTTVADYASVYTSYTPYALDYIIPDTISVSGVTGYTKVTEAKYNGSYVTRVVMLDDPALNAATPYVSTYVGMATYYRDYLKNNGVLKALEEAEMGLPLYIEVLGAIEVTEKFLTFPVTVSKQLTTFAEIKLMYNELSDAKDTFEDKRDEYLAMVEKLENVGEGEERDEKLIAKYRETAAMYDSLSVTMEDITNINFKLNGFSNGGLTATYPVKLKWENSCGGKKGFKELVAAAKEINKVAGQNFGIYPDFDFMYVNNTALFDGIGIKKTVARMVDNRYASKQEYNAVTGVYDLLNSMVVSSDNLTGLVDKFLAKYDDYGWKYLSVSTLGSDLNSNFDEDNPINRDTSSKYVEKALEKLGEYKIMLDKGNIYTVAYADHIIDATIDSSHFRYSSYTVPFYGLVLHSYVSYTGGAFNYTGSPKYDLLRAIENGSNLYYILCYENTSYLKESATLNKYYGIDYKNWYDSIVKTYNELNGLVGELQNHEIVDHERLIAERAITDEVYASNMNKIIIELLGFIKAQTRAAVDAMFDELKASNPNGYDSVKVVFDLAAIKAQATETLFLEDVTELEALGFDQLFKQYVGDEFAAEYPEDSAKNQVEIKVSDFEYEYNDAVCPYCGGKLNTENKCTKVNALGAAACEKTGEVVYEYRSAYSYITGSSADDGKNYRHTNYTSDNGNVVIVTYQRVVGNETLTTKFILNYNTFDVTVRLDGEVYEISKYGYYKMTVGGDA